MSLYSPLGVRGMKIKKVGVEAIPVIQSLAHITWAVAYKEILPEAQMKYMLELIYSKQSLQDQIEKQGHQFILLMAEDKAAGFASYSPKNKEDPSIYKLHKIYVDPGQQGKGTGKFLLEYILQAIRPMGAKTLELNVNRHNKALGFYQKMGFEITASKDIPIGNGYFMNDYIMQLSW